MNTNGKNDNTFDEMLKKAHIEIKPPDSWEGLRTRIDRRVDSGKFVSSQTAGIIFWRRLAFGMAACFLITVGILLYFLGVNYGMQEYQQKQLTSASDLLNQAAMNRLRFAFSQMRQLFGQQSRWIMVGSGDSTQMGIGDRITSGIGNGKVIVVRLAVNLDSEEAQRQYFDIVTFSNQQADFQLPLANALAIDISLKPIVRNDGKIDIEITAETDGTSQASNISTVSDDTFTSLVHMQANGNWVRIDAIGRSMSNI